MLAVDPSWNGYVTVEGAATVRSWDDTGPEELRLLLRDAFRACGGEHTDWDEYDRVMREERRAVVLVEPSRVYGFFRPEPR